MYARQLAWLITCGLCFASTICTQERPPENPTSALLAEAEAKVEAKKWLDALEQYQKILDTAASEIVSDDGRHYRQARWIVHARLARLPKEVLKQYRDRVEPQAAKRVADAIKQPTDSALLAVLADMFCCASCEEAIIELARRAFQRGAFDEATHYWHMLLPGEPSPLRFPQPKIDPSAVHARLILMQIYRQERANAIQALAEFKTKFPMAEGLLAGKTGPYATTLQSLLNQPRSTALQPAREDADWPTFAGDATRRGTLRTTLPYFWPDQHTWKMELPFIKVRPAADAPPVNPFHPRGLAFHPVIAQGQVLIADGASLFAYDAATGKRLAEEKFLNGIPTTVPSRQPVRHTLTVAHGVVYLRGGAIELRSGERASASFLMAMTMPTKEQPEFDILWRLNPPPSNDAITHFEGTPLVIDGRMYAAFWRQSPTETHAGLACYRLGTEKDIPELIWQRLIGKAATEPNTEARVRHDLLTVHGDYVLTCTHGGNIVALDRRRGVVQWEYRYPRIEQPITPRYRDLCPVCVDGTRVYAAPADSDRLLCLDLLSGQLLWEREGVEVVHLLGFAQGRLIATIGGLVKGIRGFNIHTGSDTGDTGWTISDDGGEYTFGRGIVSEEVVVWPTKHGLHFLNPRDGTLLRQPIQGSFGNLCYADGYLIVTTAAEVLGYVTEGKQLGLRQKAAQADPDNPLRQANLVRSYIDAGSFVDAEQTLDKARDQSPRGRWHLAECQRRAGEIPAATRHYRALAEGSSPFAAAGAIRFAQLNNDPQQQRQRWQEAWNTTGTVSDERGIPVTAKMFAERFAPEIIPMRGTGLHDDGVVVDEANGVWAITSERTINDPTLTTLHVSHRGVLARGQGTIMQWPNGGSQPIDWKPTQGLITANGMAVLADAARLEWLSLAEHAKGRPSRIVSLRGDGPRLTALDLPSLPLASGNEPANRITMLQSSRPLEGVSFVLNDTVVVEGYAASGEYRAHTSGSPLRKYLVNHLGEFQHVCRNTAGLEIQPLQKIAKATPWSIAGKPWLEPPVDLDKERLLYSDGDRVVLLNTTTMTEQARYILPHPSRLSGQGIRFRVDPSKRTSVAILIDRNDGVELDRLDTTTLRRVWDREPLFLGRHVSEVVVDRERIFVVADGELRVYAVSDGAMHWQYPLPDATPNWRVIVTAHSVLLYPIETVLKATTFDPLGAIQRAGWDRTRLLHAVTKSYDVWVERELPILVLSRTEGEIRQRLTFPALGPASAVVRMDDRLLVVTGQACWTLQTK